MRGDGVGVGDVGEVPSFTWGARHQTGDDDGGDAGRERDARVVGGHRRAERDEAAEPGGDGVELGDGARGGHGAGGVHGAGPRRSDRMRGDGLGVGDVGEVPGGTRGSGDTSGGDDGRGAGRERDAGVVGGCGYDERDAEGEPSRVRVGVDNGARGEHGAGGVHVPGSRRSYGMRVDGVGVGDIRAVPGSARNHGITQGRHDIVVDRAYFKSCVVV